MYNKGKKKLLLIIPNLSYGGAQVSFSRISSSLSLEYEIINVVFNSDEMADYDLDNLVNLDVPASNNIFGKIINFYRRRKKLALLKKQKGVDVSISFLEGADYINILSCQGEKIILSIRGSKKYDQNIKGILGYIRSRILIPTLYNRSDLIVALNKGVKKELLDEFNIKVPVKVIYNWFNLSYIENKKQEDLPEALKRLYQYKVIVSHGRLAPEKGYIHLIRIYAEVIKENKSYCKLVLIGSGPEKDNLIKECKLYNLLSWDAANNQELNYDCNVYFLGYKKNVYPFLSRASVFVLTSLHEGFGNSLVEAMACKLPVVSTDCPYGPDEILNPASEERESGKILKAKNGILAPLFYENNSYSAWAKILSELLKSDQLRRKYGELAFDRVSYFNLNDGLNKWKSIIR